MTCATVLAHQGGWDEILFVLAPLLIFAGLLAVARRRADQIDTEPGETTDPARAETRDGPQR